MLMPNILHEFELGVWKAVLLHLIHILFHLKRNIVTIFDERFGFQKLVLISY
jgi:hypothetical protein